MRSLFSLGAGWALIFQSLAAWGLLVNAVDLGTVAHLLLPQYIPKTSRSHMQIRSSCRHANIRIIRLLRMSYKRTQSCLRTHIPLIS